MTFIKYFRAILSGFLISLMIFLLAVFYQIGAPTESSRWIYEIHQIKSSIAKSIKTPKLVIVSGSNAHFGISCKMIYTETGVPCVNGGTHAGLGIDYILSQARLWLKPGDLVLLPLEYELYQDWGIPNYISIDYTFSREPKYLFSIDLLSKIRFIFGISLTRLQEGILGKLKAPQPLTIGYQSETLNEYGDETRNTQAKMTEKEHQIVNTLKPIKTVNEPSSYAREKIINFIDWCKVNEIKVIATWSSTVWFDIFRELTQQCFFKKIEQFYANLQIPLLGKPEDFMYDKSMFYDTSYHLNDRGVRYRTQQIIGLIRPYLQSLKKQ